MSATAMAERNTAKASVRMDKFLTFRLGKEEYGIEILRVREIIGLLDITPLPRTPAHVKGVVNLRGRIIPVVDLRSLFEMPAVEYTPATCIIFVEVKGAEDTDRFQIGVVVDGVSEVMGISPDHIEVAPKFGCSVRTDFILGMGKVKERVFILLDLDHALTEQDLKSLEQASKSGESRGGEARSDQRPGESRGA